MASNSITIVFIAFFLVLNPCLVSAFDIFSPIFDEVCKKAECGKGTCKASKNGTFPFVCECEPGWKQARPDHDSDLSFLPCVIPNCTLNYTCAAAPPPVERKDKQSNHSLFDPCRWSYCGGGTCNKTSPFTHTCNCEEGYYNILNVTALPCMRECALGMDCSGLGLNVKNNSTPPPSLAENSNGQASGKEEVLFKWLIMMTTTLLGLVLWL